MRNPLTTLLLLLWTSGLAAAQPSQPALTEAERAGVLRDLSLTLRKAYVLQDRVDEISAELERRSQSGTYRGIEDPEDFASRLTKDLVEISGDFHFSVGFDPEWIAQAEQQEASGEVVGLREDTLESLQKANFGFRALDILEGNVGYVRFDFFPDPEHSFDAVANAMNFVEHTDAVIFDMRYNRGGHNATGNYLSSFLFDSSSETQLLEFSYMENGEMKTGAHWSIASLPGEHRPEVPVYVLTGTTTFSAAEWFTYTLKKLGRATIVGRQTTGASHSITRTPIDESFLLQVPVGLLSFPGDGSDFEGVGVIPDHDVPSKTALEFAHKLALKELSSQSAQSKSEYEWLLPVLDARLNRPPAISPSRIAQITGNYDGREIRVDDGRLSYHWRERFSVGLTPIADNLFAVEGVNDFRYRFVEENGGITALERIDMDGTSTFFARR